MSQDTRIPLCSAWVQALAMFQIAVCCSCAPWEVAHNCLNSWNHQLCKRPRLSAGFWLLPGSNPGYLQTCLQHREKMRQPHMWIFKKFEAVSQQFIFNCSINTFKVLTSSLRKCKLKLPRRYQEIVIRMKWRLELLVGKIWNKVTLYTWLAGA